VYLFSLYVVNVSSQNEVKLYKRSLCTSAYLLL